MNYSITILTFVAHFITGLFPAIKAPNNYKHGISKGKLNGDITKTGPYGQRIP